MLIPAFAGASAAVASSRFQPRRYVLRALFRDVFVCVFSPDTADPWAGETSLSGRELLVRDPLASRFTQPLVASAAQSSSKAVSIWIAG
jgi:hypothetical protein